MDKKDLIIGLVIGLLVGLLVGNLYSEKSNKIENIANVENCKSYCFGEARAYFCPWTEFTKEPTNENFEFYIPKVEWESSPQVLTSDCWQELLKRVSVKNNEGLCRIRDVTATNKEEGTLITCECYYLD